MSDLVARVNVIEQHIYHQSALDTRGKIVYPSSKFVYYQGYE